MIEAQQISHQLAQKTIAYNNLTARVHAMRGDIRDVSIGPQNIPLITGSPPYIPVGKGVMSPHPQRAACRMELRGSIFDYAQAAALRLHDDGYFVVCFAAQDPRALQALSDAGLYCWSTLDVVFRADLPPTISVFTAKKHPPTKQKHKIITIRDEHGFWTEEYHHIRHFNPITGL